MVNLPGVILLFKIRDASGERKRIDYMKINFARH